MNSFTEIDQIISQTRRWIEEAVVGLNLCPFAKAIVAKDQMRIVVCKATRVEPISDLLCDELQTLHRTSPAEIDTTLIVLAQAFGGFDEFNDYLGVADAIVNALGFKGEFQIASFHPHYQFADTSADDVSNWTNRAPFPILHILREASVGRAVTTYPNPDDIYIRNIETMQSLSENDRLRIFPYLRRK